MNPCVRNLKLLLKLRITGTVNVRGKHIRYETILKYAHDERFLLNLHFFYSNANPLSGALSAS
jgi:hypothetical protein